MSRKLTTAEFIDKARLIHGDRYDYSKSVYTGKSKKIIVICPEHGEFTPIPSNHYRKKGSGCPKCAGVYQYDITGFIERAKKIHGDRYDYSKVNYKDSKTGIIIICPDHGEFTQIPGNHLMGKKCSYCSGKQTYPKDFFKKAAIIHNNKYDYTNSVYTGSSNNIEYICPIHGIIVQKAVNHIEGRGCNQCGNDCRKLNNEMFIKRAKKIHGDRYDYSKVDYQDHKTDIIIICPDHGEFTQRPGNHISNSAGCPRCGEIKVGLQRRSNTETFVKTLKNRFPEWNYDYTSVEYQTKNIPVTIICPKHGEIIKTPSEFLMGYGCAKCSWENARLTTDEIIKRAKKIHGDRYDYSRVNYTNNSPKIEIICSKHGIFHQWAKQHIHSTHPNGCPKCAHIVSRPSQQWLDSLNIPDDAEHREVGGLIVNRRYTVDGYDPDTRTVYEFHGDYFHGNPNNPKFPHDKINPTVGKTFGELYENTLKKKKTFLDADFRYIEMWETVWNNSLNSNR